MQKNDRIKSLISHLEKKFGSKSFIVKDFWGSDQDAIGLSNISESKLIYISAFIDQDNYYVALEKGRINASEYIPLNDFCDVSLEELEFIFAKHLDLLT